MEILRPDSSVVAVIASARAPDRLPDWARAGTVQNRVERKEIAIKLPISVICRRFRIRVSDRPKDTLTLGYAYLQTCRRIQNQSTVIIGCSGDTGNLSEGRRTTRVI